MERATFRGFYSCLVMAWLMLARPMAGAAGGSAETERMIILPETISIGSFFSGQNLTLKASVPSDSEMVLRWIGPPEDVVVMKKGRVAGLWMNVEELMFHNIPRAYLIWTSRMDSLAGSEQVEGILGFDSAVSGSLQGKTPMETKLLLGELFKLKEADNLYHVYKDAIRITPSPAGSGNQVDAVLSLPAKTSPGTYTFELIAWNGGMPHLLDSMKIEVVLSGLPAVVVGLAARRGLLYGIMAVVIAMLSGLMVGFIFQTRSAH